MDLHICIYTRRVSQFKAMQLQLCHGLAPLWGGDEAQPQPCQPTAALRGQMDRETERQRERQTDGWAAAA